MVNIEIQIKIINPSDGDTYCVELFDIFKMQYNSLKNSFTTRNSIFLIKGAPC